MAVAGLLSMSSSLIWAAHWYEWDGWWLVEALGWPASRTCSRCLDSLSTPGEPSSRSWPLCSHMVSAALGDAEQRNEASPSLSASTNTELGSSRNFSSWSACKRHTVSKFV
ncbi:unnamed protein product, partial [Ixodes hexagonus]